MTTRSLTATASARPRWRGNRSEAGDDVIDLESLLERLKIDDLEPFQTGVLESISIGSIQQPCCPHRIDHSFHARYSSHRDSSARVKLRANSQKTLGRAMTRINVNQRSADRFMKMALLSASRLALVL